MAAILLVMTVRPVAGGTGFTLHRVYCVEGIVPL